VKDAREQARAASKRSSLKMLHPDFNLNMSEPVATPSGWGKRGCPISRALFAREVGAMPRRHFGEPVQRRIGLDREDEIKEKAYWFRTWVTSRFCFYRLDRRRVIPCRYCCAFPAVVVPLSV